MGIPRTFRGESMAVSPSLETCANPDCSARFKKLGHGVLFAQSVEDARAWGLPPKARQKVVWLCPECANSFDLAFEPSTRQVVLHLRRPLQKGMAA